MRKFQIPQFLLNATGTTATALTQKGILPVQSGTCSGTQAEQARRAFRVPDAQVEQEHNRNEINHYISYGYVKCSGVPVANSVSEGHLRRQESERGQQ